MAPKGTFRGPFHGKENQLSPWVGALRSFQLASRCLSTTFHRITRLIPVAKIAIPMLVQVQSSDAGIRKFDHTATTAIAISRNPVRIFHLSIPESKHVGGA